MPIPFDIHIRQYKPGGQAPPGNARRYLPNSAPEIRVVEEALIHLCQDKEMYVGWVAEHGAKIQASILPRWPWERKTQVEVVIRTEFTMKGQGPIGLPLSMANKVKVILPFRAWSECGWRQSLYELKAFDATITPMPTTAHRRLELAHWMAGIKKAA